MATSNAGAYTASMGASCSAELFWGAGGAGGGGGGLGDGLGGGLRGALQPLVLQAWNTLTYGA